MSGQSQGRQVCAITGASGYVGSHIASLLSEDFDVIPMGRNAGAAGIPWALGQSESVAESLKSRSVSGLVHVAWDFKHPNPANNWFTNVEGSTRLFKDAQAAGVKRILFVSTISAFDGAVSQYGKAKLAVERIVVGLGGVVVRPGLVWGSQSGGMFGSIRQQVQNGRAIPIIGSGRYPQYLVHEHDLSECIRRLNRGDENRGRVFTLAHPRPWLLRDLILDIAAKQGKSVRLVSIPWQFIYAGLKIAETLGLKFNFRSDSVISFIRQNPSPTFDHEYPLPLRPYA